MPKRVELDEQTKTRTVTWRSKNRIILAVLSGLVAGAARAIADWLLKHLAS
ncbi:hypothetical protein [Solwaraspora sp. WMMD792]|uniref:hypothetical protein n=1 Tax=Solwaraspora sp. WMMD792 TaxID=3016099 RepID=UPI002416E73F|nr:hypothetical protein [Solwaraspora sp. WMMD792]MDG4773598.1 hypothetical protein [Solwaraspora sp. WMMD792]